MRTLIAIGIGLVLLAIVLGATWWLGPKGRGRAITGFVVVWLALCAVDMFLGVSAGYSLGEELLIHLLIFAVPGLAAYLAARWLAPRQPR